MRMTALDERGRGYIKSHDDKALFKNQTKCRTLATAIKIRRSSCVIVEVSKEAIVPLSEYCR